nr:hypothetical protein [Chitinophagaceae bacterium]
PTLTLTSQTSVKVNRIQLSLLEEVSSWIHLPTSVEISGSADGVHFSQLKILNAKEIQQQYASSKMLECRIPQSSLRAVRITFKGLSQIPKGNPGEGEHPWFFVSEILINPAP